MFLRERRKGREICKSHELPFDLVMEILTRLPAKSLMRYKSVSKLWLSLICSRYFTDRCLKVSSSSPSIYMWSFKNVLLSSSSSASESTTMSSFVIDQDLTIPAMEGYSVSQVFRGLMCFINGPSAKIYNTSTRQLVALPDIIAEHHKDKEFFMYHIGHDPVHDQYKVLCTVSTGQEGVGPYKSEHWVLLLGDGSSRWRKISSPCQPHFPLTQRLSINGRVYYLAWVHVFRSVLVSFDIRSEEISIFQELKDHVFYYEDTALIEYGGRVAILDHFVYEKKGEMDLWVMDDTKKTIWSTYIRFAMDPSQLHLLNGIRLRLSLQGTTRNGEVILIPQNTCPNPTQNSTIFHVFLYNLQNNHLRKVEIKETSNRYLTKSWDFIGLDDVENLMYL